jgi:hypothetical protein
MRMMNLAELPPGPTSPDACEQSYFKRVSAGEIPWPYVSLLMTAYLAWPNKSGLANYTTTVSLSEQRLSFRI